ncbi:hypothetical protein [Nocardia sp. NPDC050406]|uniref:hypothetical protein n=1 Tax=Nocardia sp. NPDC050406 TaxID=3364318 RepID=UPI00379DD494
MSEPKQTYDPPQSTGDPDAVETDPAALSSAEDLDEDQLRQDPYEEGMDPPEHWTGVTEYGMTQWEEGHQRPLDERLAEEEPDTSADAVVTDPDVPESDVLGMRESDEDLGTGTYEEDLGIAADVAGGSVPQEIREPDQPE